jgi:hypothetical protein
MSAYRKRAQVMISELDVESRQPVFRARSIR